MLCGNFSILMLAKGWDRIELLMGLESVLAQVTSAEFHVLTYLSFLAGLPHGDENEIRNFKTKPQLTIANVKTVIRARYGDLQTTNRSRTNGWSLFVGYTTQGNNATVRGRSRGNQSTASRRTVAAVTVHRLWLSASMTPIRSPATAATAASPLPQVPVSSGASRRTTTANDICHKCHKQGHDLAFCPVRVSSTCDGRGQSAEICQSMASLLVQCRRKDEVFEVMIAPALTRHAISGELFDGDIDWGQHEGPD